MPSPLPKHRAVAPQFTPLFAAMLAFCAGACLAATEDDAAFAGSKGTGSPVDLSNQLRGHRLPCFDPKNPTELHPGLRGVYGQQGFVICRFGPPIEDENGSFAFGETLWKAFEWAQTPQTIRNGRLHLVIHVGRSVDTNPRWETYTSALEQHSSTAAQQHSSTAAQQHSSTAAQRAIRF